MEDDIKQPQKPYFGDIYLSEGAIEQLIDN